MEIVMEVYCSCAGAGVQGEEQEDKGDPPHVSGRSVLQVKVKKVCVHIN